MAVQVAPALAPSMLNTAGETSEAHRGLLVTVPLVQLRLTLTLAVLLSLKFLCTVKDHQRTTWTGVLTMVQLPLSGSPFWQPDSFLVYPDGTEFSVAVQVAPALAPSMLNTAGEASEAHLWAVGHRTAAAAQADAHAGRVAVTEVLVHGEIINSYFVQGVDDGATAVKRIAVLAVGLILGVSEGTEFSVAVQVAPALAPSMLNAAGEASEAHCGLLVTVPLLQFRLTLTLAELPSLKSLYTVKSSTGTSSSVLTMVQLPLSGSPFWQPDSFLV